MLKRLHVQNFTVFAEAEFEFSPGLNVIVGTNGTGKSHVLKLGYAVEKTRTEVEQTIKSYPAINNGISITNLVWTLHLFRELPKLFLTENVEGFIRQNLDLNVPGAEVQAEFKESLDNTLNFNIWNRDVNGSDTASLTVKEPYPLLRNPSQSTKPIIIPAKEVLSLYSWLPKLNDKYAVTIDQTYIDLCDQLGSPLLREVEDTFKYFLNQIGEIMKGKIILENENFYLYPTLGGRVAINMVAEGIRKFGMLAQLLSNGSLTKETTLFWDEPEANLNPALLKKLAALLVQLAGQGFQIILATHSLFLLKEFHILSRQQQTPVRYFGLSAEPGAATTVTMTDNLEELPDIAALDAELEQSDKFLDVLNQEDADGN